MLVQVQFHFSSLLFLLIFLRRYSNVNDGKNSEEGNLLTLKTSAKMVANKIMVTKTLQK